MTATKLGLEPRSRSLGQNVDEGSTLCISNDKSESSWETPQSKPLRVDASLARKFVMRIEFGSKGWQGVSLAKCGTGGLRLIFCADHMQNLIYWRTPHTSARKFGGQLYENVSPLQTAKFLSFR
jgi:hypothetical protein